MSFIKENRRSRQFVHAPKRSGPIGSEDLKELHGRGYDDRTVPMAGQCASRPIFELSFMVNGSYDILWIFAVQR